VPQVAAAISAFPDGVSDAIAARVTSRPGRAARLLRRQMYRLLRLSEPSTAPAVAPVPVPRLVGD
jgi:hypothetical protein